MIEPMMNCEVKYNIPNIIMRILESDFRLMKFSAREIMFITASPVEFRSADITAASFTTFIYQESLAQIQLRAGLYSWTDIFYNTG
jgi:hypothetical protein